MSSPLAIGAVSAVLRNLLDNGLVEIGAPVSPVAVTALAPDRIDLDNADAPPSLNLFLYRTTRNQGWAQVGMPSYNASGSRLSNPPLALDLHYLLTAYGSADFQAEILLGYAMHLLHERPVLDRAAIRRALDPSPLGATILPPAFQALTASDLADQVESISISPEPMDSEEMSRLWSAIQTHYRPTATYVVTVVLIEARKPTHKALPVLVRGGLDADDRERGVLVSPSLVPPYPTIDELVLEDSHTAARLGEKVVLSGHHLNGTGVVARFAHRLLENPNEINIGANADPNEIEVTLPSSAAAQKAWPAGVYTVSVLMVPPGEAKPRPTNVVAMLLAPQPVLPPTTVTRNGATRRVTLVVTVQPEIRPAQDVVLALGGEMAAAESHPTQTGTLTFNLGDVPPNAQWVRLTVDGVESRLVDRSHEPPRFDPAQSVAVPA